MARKPKTYHYIYKTTCSVTGRYYVGMHSTNNLEDEYLGSGKQLWYSIRKHGSENHTREILEFLESREALRNREHQLVNTDLLNDPMCMNLITGGEGGWQPSKQKEMSERGNAKVKWLYENDESWANAVKEKLSTAAKGKKVWLGKTHTSETKKKMRESHLGKHTGSKNSQFDTKWITDGRSNRKIKSIESIPEHWKLGRTIKSPVSCSGNHGCL